MVSSLGIKSFYHESDDPYTLYKFLEKKIDFKDINSGPYFFEFKNYRWREHCGPNFDNNIGYRQKKEFRYWMKKDPLKRIKKRLNFLSKSKIEYLEKRIKKEILEAFKYAETSKFPNPNEAYKGVYAK